jgi:hypothetical protein
MNISQYSRTLARTEAKQRYNEKHYEQIKIYCVKGARTVVQQLAQASGMSMAEYIRHCIISDAQRRGIDVRAEIGGGGSPSTIKAIADQMTAPWA